MAPAAVALAMTGEGKRAQTIMDDLGHRFPDDTILHQVSIPVVRALVELEGKAPEKAIEALQPTTPYELGTAQGLLPIYIRGQAYLQAKRGAEAVQEFQRIVDHRGIASTFSRAFSRQAGLGPGLHDHQRCGEGQSRVIRISLRCGRTPIRICPF